MGENTSEIWKEKNTDVKHKILSFLSLYYLEMKGNISRWNLSLAYFQVKFHDDIQCQACEQLGYIFKHFLGEMSILKDIIPGEI